MELTRSKELTVRMGDYESFKFKAEVRASHHDLGLTDEGLASAPASLQADLRKSLSELVAQTLDTELQDDIEDALDLGQDRNSFLQRAHARTPLQSTPKTRRRRTT